MFTNMTVLSRQAFETAMDESLTVEEAVAYLEKQLQFRSLRNKIDRYSGGKTEKEVRTLLVSGLLQNHPEMKKDSVERRVRGWMKSKKRSRVEKKEEIEDELVIGIKIREKEEFVEMV